jgi:hypothetical protein
LHGANVIKKHPSKIGLKFLLLQKSNSQIAQFFLEILKILLPQNGDVWVREMG